MKLGDTVKLEVTRGNITKPPEYNPNRYKPNGYAKSYDWGDVLFVLFLIMCCGVLIWVM